MNLSKYFDKFLEANAVNDKTYKAALKAKDNLGKAFWKAVRKEEILFEKEWTQAYLDDNRYQCKMSYDEFCKKVSPKIGQQIRKKGFFSLADWKLSIDLCCTYESRGKKIYLDLTIFEPSFRNEFFAKTKSTVKKQTN